VTAFIYRLINSFNLGNYEHGFVYTHRDSVVCSMRSCANHNPGTINIRRSEAVDYRCLGLSPSRHCQVSLLVLVNFEQRVALTARSWCMVGTEEYQIVGPTRTQDFQAQYTQCHMHSTTTWVYAATSSVTLTHCLLVTVLTMLGRMFNSSLMVLEEVERPHTQTNTQMNMPLKSQLVLVSIVTITQVFREYCLYFS
jgi:hypothetical protein